MPARIVAGPDGKASLRPRGGCPRGGSKPPDTDRTTQTASPGSSAHRVGTPDKRRKSGHATVGQFLVAERDQAPDGRRRGPLGIGKTGPHGELRPVRKLDGQGAQQTLELALPCLVSQHDGFRIVEGLDLEQRERTADLVRGARLPQHQALASQRLHAGQFLAQLGEPPATLLLVQPGIGLAFRADGLGQELQSVFVAAGASRCVEDEEADLLPQLALVLAPDDTHRALELLGCERGDYKKLHPLEDVNMSQSTNDVYPTAVKVALRFKIDELIAGMEILRLAFAEKAEEFKDILKMGRTQLQDAVPMTLGQEFSTYAVMLEEDQQRLREAALLIQEINLGATAIGTGINAHPDYAALAQKHLSELTGIQYITASNLVEATQDAGAFVQLSGVLKRVAVKLSKVCNDLRLLSSGPRTGFGEINLPAVQAGSSIMPGKVNPVIPEVVNQIAFLVIGNDVTVSFAAEGGQLQLNAFEPIIAHSLFDNLVYLRQGCVTLAERCVKGITANREHLDKLLQSSIGIVTALNPLIGYENATSVAMEAHATGRSVAEIVLERGLLTKEQLNEVLRPEVLTQPRWIKR